MKYLDYDFFENEMEDMSVFAEYLDKFDRLLKKVTYNQRVFLNTLKEVVDADVWSDDWIYEEYIFAGYVEMYDKNPELIPDAPVDILMKCLPNREYRNEFHAMTEIMRYWADVVKANKRPLNRIANRLIAFPKTVIYTVFVAIMVVFFVTGMNMIHGFSLGFSMEMIKQILIMIITGYFSAVLAKTIVLKVNLKRVKSLYV